MDPLVVLGGADGAARIEREEPGLAWSIRSAAHQLVVDALPTPPGG